MLFKPGKRVGLFYLWWLESYIFYFSLVNYVSMIRFSLSLMNITCIVLLTVWSLLVCIIVLWSGVHFSLTMSCHELTVRKSLFTYKSSLFQCLRRVQCINSSFKYASDEWIK